MPVYEVMEVCQCRSLPSRECGLKSTKALLEQEDRAVTPFAGVWIEIKRHVNQKSATQSLPSRECGLKFLRPTTWNRVFGVTPFAGVWIEIEARLIKKEANIVTPFAGVWIEIQNMKLEHRQKISLSS